MGNPGSRARGVELVEHPLADVRVGPIFVVGEHRQNAAQFAHTLGGVITDEASFDESHVSAMGHGHDELIVRL